jgi:DNA-binding IclR family transcriptional regulator
MGGKMASIGSTARVLAVIEALSSAPDEGIVTQNVIERSGLAPSTVYRLLMELEAAGLVYRTADRRMHANFLFERRLSFRHISPPRIAEACSHLSDCLQSASEVIVLRGQNLWWHFVQQHPAQAIRLRAHTGYARAPYELDSISRLALAYLPIGQIERTWDATAFFDVGVDHAPVSWPQARDKIAAVDRDGMQYDLQGNTKGIRRFCIAVRDGERLGCLLTVAEAATPLRDITRHVERMRLVLTQQRDAIEQAGATAANENGEAGAA